MSNVICNNIRCGHNKETFCTKSLITIENGMCKELRRPSEVEAYERDFKIIDGECKEVVECD